jgi:glycine/D-amino acid oxidase-like deaminating enzyme
MRVAVLGAGLTGSLVALELADAGFDVCLFDRLERPMSGASLNCEGKIHLGYVYALDRSRRTAMTMLRGAAAFRPLLERWTGTDLFTRALSAPFLYAVPHDSLLPVEAIREHFSAVSERATDLAGPMRLPPNAGRWVQLESRHFGQTFDPKLIAAVFQTEERAIDTEELAQKIRSAVDTSPRLQKRMHSQITGLSQKASGYDVNGACADLTFAEPFDIVVNALWEHRIHIDATLGLPVSRDVMHRFKYGVFSRHPAGLVSVPNVTFLIGPYGDVVVFRTSAYLSWYPSCLISQERAIRPSLQDNELLETGTKRILAGTLDNLRRLMPALQASADDSSYAWTLKGGFVTAWGRQGIEEAASELHERYDVGVHSTGDYHSIDTGKLTLAPLFAREASARIIARHGGPR